MGLHQWSTVVVAIWRSNNLTQCLEKKLWNTNHMLWTWIMWKLHSARDEGLVSATRGHNEAKTCYCAGKGLNKVWLNFRLESQERQRHVLKSLLQTLKHVTVDQTSPIHLGLVMVKTCWSLNGLRHRKPNYSFLFHMVVDAKEPSESDAKKTQELSVNPQEEFITKWKVQWSWVLFQLRLLHHMHPTLIPNCSSNSRPFTALEIPQMSFTFLQTATGKSFFLSELRSTGLHQLFVSLNVA